ncbi:MAG TPA: cold shock domain-containing protein [Actinomycetota bacterium]|nr:cold shock domain-containing protein [Actinomycetota bacterium]
MPQGTVKEFDRRNHNGVLLLDDRTEIYFDQASLEGSQLRYLRIGQRVKFDLHDEYGRQVARRLEHITLT